MYIYKHTHTHTHTHIYIYIYIYIYVREREREREIQTVEYKIGAKASDKCYDVEIDCMYIWRRNDKEEL